MRTSYLTGRVTAKTLSGYHLLPATHADLLRRMHRLDEAAVHYREALSLATNDSERRFLTRRLRETTTVD
jgi:RNA polymerase sigma-70 factor, ECF subfamily